MKHDPEDEQFDMAVIWLVACGLITLIGLILADPMAHFAHDMLETGR